MTLLEHDPNAPAAWAGELPVSSRYTYGLAGERFFRALKDEGKIMGSVCPDCLVTYVPAAAFCERCLRPLDEWLDMGLTGEVLTFTVLFVNQDGSPRLEPEIIAFIQMGNGGLVHSLSGIAPEEVEIGMAVEAVLRPKRERTGSILDISHFIPK